MTIDEQIEAIIAARLERKGSKVRDPVAMAALIRRDLDHLRTENGDDAILAEYERLTGTGRHLRIVKRKADQAEARDYQLTEYDHALTDAVHVIERRTGPDADAPSAFTPEDAWAILTRDHPPAVASRALNDALAGNYRTVLPVNHRHDQATPAEQITKGEYDALVPPAPTT